MGLIGRLRAAWAALVSDEHDNESHRYGIVIGDMCYLADSYSVDPYNGLPEWDYHGADGNIHVKYYGDWVLKEYQSVNVCTT